MMRTDRFRLTHETLDHNSSRNEGRVTLESEDWKKLPTVQERRRVQNRIAQRKFSKFANGSKSIGARLDIDSVLIKGSSAKKVSAKQCDSEKSLDQRLNLQDSVDPGFFQSDYVLAGLADTSNSMAQTMPPLDDAALTVPHYSQNFFPPLGVGWTANQEDNAEGRLEGNALGEDVMISQDAETIFPQVPKRNESSAIPSHVQQKAFAVSLCNTFKGLERYTVRSLWLTRNILMTNRTICAYSTLERPLVIANLSVAAIPPYTKRYFTVILILHRP